MHGLVFASFEQFAAQHGQGVAREYADDRAYPDEALTQEVEALARSRGLAPEAVEREFGHYLGRHAFPQLAPEFFDAHANLLAALLHVDEEIHERVRAVVDGAVPPRLRVSALGDHGAVIAYTSERRLCALLEGLVHGTAEYYGEHVTVEHPQCMLRGEPACSLVVEIPSRAPRAAPAS